MPTFSSDEVPVSPPDRLPDDLLAQLVAAQLLGWTATYSRFPWCRPGGRPFKARLGRGAHAHYGDGESAVDALRDLFTRCPVASPYYD